MATDNEPDRLAHIARAVWFGIPTSDVRVYIGEGKAEVVDMPEGTVLISVRHPEAPRALEAVLKVLNEDERMPSGLHDPCNARINALSHSTEVLRTKYKIEVQKREILKDRLLGLSKLWEEEAPYQAAYLKHLAENEL